MQMQAKMKGRSCVVIRLLASHQGEPGSIPGGVGFSHMRIVPGDAAGRWVFSGISRFPSPCIPALLQTRLASPLSVVKTSMLRAAQISSFTHYFSYWEFPPNTAVFIKLLVYLEAAKRIAAEKRSPSKLLMKTVHFERETTAIGTRSKTNSEPLHYQLVPNYTKAVGYSGTTLVIKLGGSGLMWEASGYDIRSPLLVIRRTLTAQRYVSDISRPHVSTLTRQHPRTVFQQDNARPHTPACESVESPLTCPR
ncbi:hypothetical protein PR048_014754 [Dryococelus australis]|uniref:Uncharacterized protein n=1 Tax=Dryococelus australis TaxID=614101 RepID=A0ABQ9HF12_9NEOP|nr:hypothetical protein PR048_014754 [Dryococelus australis]